MKEKMRHIILLMSGILMLLLTGCSQNEGNAEKQLTIITFYVYAPERPMPTRAGDPLVNATETENVINRLQIWVFNHDDGNLVGYLAPSNMPTAEGTVYSMKVSDAFANAATKPHVDVYVAANTAAVGMMFDENTTRAVLQDAVFGTESATVDYFGITSPQTTIDGSIGLPMSGVLLDQPVSGENPILCIGTNNQDGMAKVKLQRAVSKVRFLFCEQETTGDHLTIKGVTIQGGNDYGFPTKEYLFLQGTDPYRIGAYYVEAAASILSAQEEPMAVRSCIDPSVYVYKAQNGQDYEDLIEQGIHGTTANLTPELTQVGPFYFRETNHLLKGTIAYKIGDTENTKEFTMTTENGFARNHSWVVYAYYSSDGLDVITVFVKPWTTSSTEAEHSVYNW